MEEVFFPKCTNRKYLNYVADIQITFGKPTGRVTFF